jgi:UDP-N-acetylmuramate: L-alanyl-gamma-D-glutamyl-meso-diaminopimelate ligase
MQDQSFQLNFKHVHIVGVCGTLMGAFAAFLKRSGVRVTGSDQNVYPPMSDVLNAAGVELFSPYSAENLTKIQQSGANPDLVVIGNVISAGNVEMVEVKSRGLPFMSLPEFMEQHLLPQTRNLVVAGTHGKTTTSSLLAHVLTECDQDPSYFIGGVSQNLPHSFHVTPSKYFVLEGDEYDTAFWDKVPKFNHYLPNDVILTSVEFDHADIYADLNAVIQAFLGLMNRIRSGGRLIACVENENVRTVMKQAKVPVITYSRNQSDLPDFSFSNLKSIEVSAEENGIEFDVIEKNKSGPYTSCGKLQLRLPGEHNALNALAVWIECRAIGLSHDQIAAGLKSFQGIKRRQEERGSVKGILVIDDFAHHPTAVRETLNALKAKYVGRRLLTVFEPRSATSRRKVFQKEYTEAFDSADAIWIAAAYDQKNIPTDQQFSSPELVAGLRNRGKAAEYFETTAQDVSKGIDLIVAAAKQGDVIAVLSNGGFGGFIPKLLSSLK